MTWLALVAGGLATGASLVALLVLRKAGEALVAGGGLLAFALSAGAFVSIATGYERIDAVLYGFAFMVASVGGGYALASSLLDRLAQGAPQPTPLDDPVDTTAGPAVVVASCIEPPDYEPKATAMMLQMLTDEGLLEATMGALPFLFFAQKARYRALGGNSPSQGELELVTAKLDESLPNTPVHWASCWGESELWRRVRTLAENGHSPIIVARLALADSGRLAEAERLVGAMHLESCGVEVRHTDLLANSERIASMVALNVMNAIDEPATTGVVLVAHGQPEARAHRNPEFDADESRFLNRIRLLLSERGLAENNIKVAWAEWRSLDVSSSVRHLAALGCRRVLVVPACFPFDSLGTRLDLEIAVRQARVDDSVAVVTLPAWRDDPLLVEELRARITDALAEN